MFDLLMKGEGGRFTLRYDPYQSLLTWPTGEKVSLANVGLGYAPPRAVKPVPRATPNNLLSKDADPTMLTIQMGLACNYSCDYCIQGADHHPDKDGSVGLARDFIDRLSTWFNPDPNKPLLFQIWGGEPLVYWKTLKVLLPALAERYPWATMITVTNGSLLDREKIDWLSQFNLWLRISHDGANQAVRGPDPLEDPKMVDAWRYAIEKFGNRLSFSVVLTKDFYSLTDHHRWLADKLGSDQINLFTRGLARVMSAREATELPSTPEEHRDIRVTWAKEFRSPEIAHSTALGIPLRTFFDDLVNQTPADNIGLRCRVDDPKALAVTLKGEAQVCQNRPTRKIGSVYELDKIALTHTTHWAYRDPCSACPIFNFCRGACGQSGDGKEFDTVCDSRMPFGLALLKTALFYITGAELEEIKGERVRFPGITSLKFDEAAPIRPKARKIIPIHPA